MQYIHLTNDSYIIKTSYGVFPLTRKSFNFTKIKKLLAKGASEEELRPLFKAPSLPNGLYEAYLIDTNNTLYYKHITDTEVDVKSFNSKNPNPSKGSFLGVYPSLEDLMADWPEYIL